MESLFGKTCIFLIFKTNKPHPKLLLRIQLLYGAFILKNESHLELTLTYSIFIGLLFWNIRIILKFLLWYSIFMGLFTFLKNIHIQFMDIKKENNQYYDVMYALCHFRPHLPVSVAVVCRCLWGGAPCCGSDWGWEGSYCRRCTAGGRPAARNSLRVTHTTILLWVASQKSKLTWEHTTGAHLSVCGCRLDS